MSDTTTTTELPQYQSGELPRNWGALLTLGILMLVLGTIGLIWTPAYTIGVAMVFGAFLVTAGSVQLISAFTSGESNWKGRLTHVLIALVYLVGGGFALFNPPGAAAGLTLFIASMLLAIGVIRIVHGIQQKKRGWAWLWPVVLGLIDILIGIILAAGWPVTSVWAPGLLFAIELLMNGWYLVLVAWASRKIDASK